MSESAKKQKFTLSGLLSALLLVSGATGVSAASLHQEVSALALSRVMLAQAEETVSNEAPPDEVPVDGEWMADESVPFSELNEALTTARSKLAELTKAAEIAKVAGELRDELQAVEIENRQLKSVLSQLQTQNAELLSAKQASESLIEELEKGAAEASAEAARLDDELESMRWQNSQVSNSLAEAETAVRETSEDLANTRDELEARQESLTATVDESAAEITRLQRELDETTEQLLAAERQKASSLAELEALTLTTTESTEETARLGKDLDGVITELASTRGELTTTQGALDESDAALRSAEQEAGILREQLAGSRSEASELRERLTAAEIDLEGALALNAGLEQQVAVLKTAAGEATQAARQNLLAVEDQINEINAALAFAKADELLSGQEGAVPGENGSASSEQRRTSLQPAAGGNWVPRPSPPRGAGGQQLIAAVAADTAQPSSTVQNPLAGATSRPPVAQPADGRQPSVNLASLTTDLPEDRRDDAEFLLRELKAARGARGLSMTVPGTLLFAVDSEQIEPEAFDPLSRVAGLVDLYEGRDILIVGHTDAVGDAEYNQQLSERRAALVKKFFVENFQIAADRMQIEGKGEQDPITSNATEKGRDANRRVEVVILN